jgi:hypothetical protein
MKLRPSRRRNSAVPDRVVVAPTLEAFPYGQLRRAATARIREVGDMVAVGRPDEAQRAFDAAIAIDQELHVSGWEYR